MSVQYYSKKVKVRGGPLCQDLTVEKKKRSRRKQSCEDRMSFNSFQLLSPFVGKKRKYTIMMRNHYVVEPISNWEISGRAKSGGGTLWRLNGLVQVKANPTIVEKA